MGPPSGTSQSIVHSRLSPQHLWTTIVIWCCRQGPWNGTEHRPFPSRHHRVSGWPLTPVHLTLSLAKGSWERLLAELLQSSIVPSLALQTGPWARETCWLYDPRNDHGPEFLWLPKGVIQPLLVPQHRLEHILYNDLSCEVDLAWHLTYWFCSGSILVGMI